MPRKQSSPSSPTVPPAPRAPVPRRPSYALRARRGRAAAHGRRMPRPRPSNAPACYFFVVGAGGVGLAWRVVKADCAAAAFGLSFLGFFGSRLLRF